MLRCKIRQDILKKVLRILKVPSDVTFPLSIIAYNPQFQVENNDIGTVTFKYFDGIKFITLSFSAEAVSPGEIRFPARYIKYLENAGADVEIVENKNHLIFRNVGNFKVPFFAGEPLPDPVRVPLGSVTMDVSEIKNLFKKVAFAVGNNKEDPRYTFGGILLDCAPSRITAIGTDRRVLAVASMPKGSPYVGKFFLPKDGVSTISRIDGDMATLTFCEKAVEVSISGDIMCDIFIPECNMIFPDIGNLISFEPKTTLTGDKEAFLYPLSVMRMVSANATLNKNMAEIRLWHDTSYIKQKPRFFTREESGSNVENIAEGLEWQGEDIKCRVNAKTLMSAIEQAEGKVTINFVSDVHHISLTDETGNYTCAITPYSPAEKK